MIGGLAELGLLFLMFLAGSEVRARPGAGERRVVAVVAVTGLVLPFATGLAVARLLDPGRYSGPNGSATTFALVFGVAVAVTSIPVISRILLDLGLLGTGLARVVLSVAVVEDVVLYVVLAVALGLAQGHGSEAYGLPGLLPTHSAAPVAAFHVGIAVLFLAAVLAGGARAFRWLAESRANVLERRSPVAFRLAFLLSLVLLCVVLGVNPVFGALAAGLSAARADRSRAAPGSWAADSSEAAWDALRQFALAFFVPVYFAVVGVRLDLVRQFDPVFFAWFCALACAVKAASVWLGARLAGEPNERATTLAVALNARGGPGIVLATVTLSAGVVNERFFTALVVLSVLTSQAAGVWLERVAGRLALHGDAGADAHQDRPGDDVDRPADARPAQPPLQAADEQDVEHPPAARQRVEQQPQKGGAPGGARAGRDELRQERHEEHGHLDVEQVAEHAQHEGPPGSGRPGPAAGAGERVVSRPPAAREG